MILSQKHTLNAISVDVEDYFQVRSLEHRISFKSWDSYETRFERNTRGILELLEKHATKGTFFVLGWNAKKDPNLVREIARAGHEIASHGWSHRLVYRLDRSEFREDVSRTKSLLEDTTGSQISGFRAANYSITEKSLWALEILAETGHTYDSSIYPIHRGVYGIASENRRPHVRKAGQNEIAEFPMSTARLAMWNLPFASGAYLRFMPLWITKSLLRLHNRRNTPTMVSVHPWELDPEQPRVCPIVERPNHYLCLGRTRPILEDLLRTFHFRPVREVLEDLGLL